MKISLLVLAVCLVIFVGLFAAGSGAPDADAKALLLAKQAYVTAQACFADCGEAGVDFTALTSLGLYVPEDIRLEIADGKPESLVIRVSHVKGGFVHEIDATGTIKSTPRRWFPRLLARFSRSPAPPPAGIREPRVVRHYPDPGAATRMAARNAYNAAEYYFISNPDGAFGREDLGQYCMNRNDGVIIEILNGRRDFLRIRARHPDSGVVWEVDAQGRMTSPAQAPGTVPPATVLKQPSKEEIQAAADDEARETAGKVFGLARSYLAEYSPTGGLKMDALKRAYPGYSISPDIVVEIVDRREENLRLKVWHKEGSRVFEVDPKGGITSGPLT